MNTATELRKIIIGKHGRKGWSVTLLPVKGFPTYLRTPEGGDLWADVETAKSAAFKLHPQELIVL